MTQSEPTLPLRGGGYPADPPKNPFPVLDENRHELSLFTFGWAYRCLGTTTDYLQLTSRANYTCQLKQYLAGIKAGRGYSLITGLKEEVK